MKHRFIAKRYWNDMPNAFSAEKEDVIEDLIPLTYGDPDFTTPDAILNPTFEDVRNGHTHYTELCGYKELRLEVCKFFLDRFGMKIKKDETYITNGAGHGLYIALESILDDGDEVIIHQPYYSPYIDQVKLARGIPVFLDTYEKENFEIDPSRLRSKITNRTKAIIINNPNNPTGATFSKKCLESIAAIAEEYDLIVIADEVYGLYNYETPFVPFVSLDRMRERTITLCSASKDFAMTGWRVGYTLAPDFLIERMKRVNENDSIMASSVAQRALLHGLQNRQEVQKVLYEEYKDRMQYAYGRIKSIPKISVLPPKATFYLFANITETGLSSDEITQLIHDEAHVAVFPGSAFGECGEGYIRIACTVGMDQLKDAFDRISLMNIFSN